MTPAEPPDAAIPHRGWRTDRCWCIAHRGGAREFPENTLEAFVAAVALGADMVEMDARLAADGVPVVLHDPTLDRTTTASGPVSARRSDELAGLGVPSLPEAVKACAPLPVTIELKEGGDLPAAAVEALRQTGRAGEAIVGAFESDWLAQVRQTAPEVATSLGQSEAAALVGAGLEGRPPALPPQGAVALQVPPTYRDVDVITTDVIAAAHAVGLAVHVWTVDAADEMRRLAQLGVDGIMSDRPGLLRQVLDEWAV